MQAGQVMQRFFFYLFKHSNLTKIELQIYIFADSNIGKIQRVMANRTFKEKVFKIKKNEIFFNIFYNKLGKGAVTTKVARRRT